MKKLTLLFAALLVISISYSQDWGVIRYASSNINVRLERSTSSQIVSTLNKGDKVKADLLYKNWYAIYNVSATKHADRIGYVYAPLLLPNKPDVSTKQPGDSSFKIIEKSDVSYQGRSRMVYRVRLNVNKIPSDDDIKKVSNSIWKNGNTRWDEFTVFTYLPEMNTGSTAYGVAEFRRSGLTNFNTNDIALWGTKWKK